MNHVYGKEEKEVFEILSKLGIPDVVVEDCLASRSYNEICVIAKFLRRYKSYFNNSYID